MTRYAVLGFAESWREAPFDDRAVTLVGLNELYKYLPRWDEWVEIHDEDSLGLTRRALGQDSAEVAAHKRWLEAQGPERPIWMQPRFCDGRFPGARPYPLDAVQRAFGRLNGGQWRYLTSTVALALAMLIVRGRDDALRVVGDDAAEWIGLYGIELIGQGEYQHQRPCAEFLVGLAMGLGIEVYVPASSALLKADHIYGYERPLADQGAVSRQRLVARRERLRRMRDEKAREFYQLKGALLEAENWLTVIEGAARGVGVLPAHFLDERPILPGGEPE